MDQISITDSKRSWLAPGKGGMRGVIKNKIVTAWLNDVLLRSRQSNNIQVVQARLNFSLVHMILGKLAYIETVLTLMKTKLMKLATYLVIASGVYWISKL